MTTAWAPWGARLRALRLARGLTQIGLGDACNLSEPTVSCLERGTRSPSFETLAALCGALGMSPKQFFEEA